MWPNIVDFLLFFNWSHFVIPPIIIIKKIITVIINVIKLMSTKKNQSITAETSVQENKWSSAKSSNERFSSIYDSDPAELGRTFELFLQQQPRQHENGMNIFNTTVLTQIGTGMFGLR